MKFIRTLEYDKREAYLKFKSGGNKARVLNENSHNGHSIRVTNTLSIFKCSLVKPCFLPVYRPAIMSIVCLVVPGFTGCSKVPKEI